MSGNHYHFPHAMNTRDINVMREAVRLAADRLDVASKADLDLLAAIVFGYYWRGLVDAHKLCEVAAFAASSRVFRSNFRRGTDQLFAR